MEWSLLFFVNSILLGVGLAMDAFSVSLANGLHETDMKKNKMCGIAGTFAFFQAAMPMIGWICVHTIIRLFAAFEKLIPWIALLLLLFIGGKMILEALKKDENGKVGVIVDSDGSYHTVKLKDENENENTKVGFAALVIQGIATSIDALSVGFTIAEYDIFMALICALIIAAVTFVICIVGLVLGKKFGTRFGNKATMIGGIILIFIGIEIFIKGVFL